MHAGVAHPSIVTPYRDSARFKRRELSVSDMVDGIVKRNVTLHSQAETLIEKVNPQQQAKAQEENGATVAASQVVYTP